MDVRAVNLLLSANSIVDHVDDDGALFFTPVTFDGVSEAEPLLGTVSNLPGDGVEFRFISNSASNAPFPLSSLSQVCFDSGMLQLPADTDQPIRITEQHISQEDDVGNLLESTRRSLLFLEPAPEGPRIDSVDVSRVAGGQQVVVRGAGFSGTVEANQVTVEGNSRIPATVLEASPDSLTLRLPDELVSGPLQVEVGGAVSNDYQLQVLFAPQLEIALGGEGPAPAVDLTLTQETGEISLFGLELEASSGQWNTNGFTEGESVGSILLPNPVLGDLELDVVVATSDAESLILDALDPDDVTQYQIELRNSPRKLLTLTSQEVMSTIAFSRFQLNLRITEDVFVSPQGAIDLSIKLTSAPRRTLFPETSLVIERTQTLP